MKFRGDEKFIRRINGIKDEIKEKTDELWDKIVAEFSEEFLIFLSVVEWIFLSSLIGVIVGGASAFFLKTLDFAVGFASGFNYYFLLMPFAFSLSYIMIKKIAPEAEGHGTEKVIEAIHKRSGRINFLVVPVKLIASVITIASGGSAGKEGPCAQIGGGLASAFASVFRFSDEDRKKIVICGISAGFSAVFGTPIAGAIFGIEVLFVGQILYESILPSFISGMISYYVASSLGVHYIHHRIEFVPNLEGSFLFYTVLAGIFFGICSVLLIISMKVSESISRSISREIPKYITAFFAGLFLVGLSVLISQDYLGLGVDKIISALNGEKVKWYDFLMKILFTSVTLSFGGSGGILTPIFFIGVTAGGLFAQIFDLDIPTFSAIGLIALLSGATNTPIASTIMAVELFGLQIVPYAGLAATISFLITGHKSVYPSQIVSMRKSPFVKVKIGEEIEDIVPEPDIPKTKFALIAFKTIRLLRRFFSTSDKSSHSNQAHSK